MQVNVAGIRRNIKNLAHNYSDAQIKVREATSNDLWGPPSTLMAEIADLTYNMVAFSEIMQMIWKRLNDHGKNWRHVHKALVLLEYLIKTGSEKVAQQCKENIFAIQTLHEFQYIEEGKDQGMHVRDKAKALVTLLRDDERLKNERVKALKAKERFAQHPSGFGSDGSIDGPNPRDPMHHGWQDPENRVPQSANEIEFVRPLTVNEEELQLQLAMAMSREEAVQEEAKRRSDDVRLQLALSQSEQDFKDGRPPPPEPQQSHLLDLLDINLGAASISSPTDSRDPWNSSQKPQGAAGGAWGKSVSPPMDPWTAPVKTSADGWNSRNESPSITTSGSSTEGWLDANSSSSKPSDPWMGKSANSHLNQLNNNGDPWQAPSATNGASAVVDPWAPVMGARPSPVGAITSPASELDEFDIITNRSKTANNNNNVNLLDDMDPLKPSTNGDNNNFGNNKSTKPPLKTPHSFLGENSALVNLDNLIKPVSASNNNNSNLNNTGLLGVGAQSNNNPYNPFGESTGLANPQRSFFPQQPVPSINQLKQQQPFPVTMNQQDPWAPVNNASNSTNTQNNNLNWTNNNVEQRTALSPSNPFLS